MSETDGLIFAVVFDGQGGGHEVEWDGIAAWKPADGTLWVHINTDGARANDWVRSESGVAPAIADTLLAPGDHRPRVQTSDSSLLAILRGVNFNPGADPEDLIGLHMWIEERLIVSVRRRRVRSGQAIRERLAENKGPCDVGEFLVMVATLLLEPLAELVRQIDEQIDAIEEALVRESYDEVRGQLREARQLAIVLRRYLSPQRDALAKLATTQVKWLDGENQSYIREIADSTTRYVEDLDSLRERASVIQEELTTQLAERTNKTIYVLTIFSAVLLPAALLTGLFGINVGGMPWVKSEAGFWIVLGGVPTLAVLVIAFLKLRRMI
ncbi:MAG TPA: CorA family divalent cation transporter [Alphaproteobacteria bacterium]|nr:CorA family divalent cation transporter [Alphaproteobacteria bacterium]